MVNFNPGIGSFQNLYGGPQKPGDPDPTKQGSSTNSSSSDAKSFAEKAKTGEIPEEVVLNLMKALGIQPSGDKDADMKKLVAKMSGEDESTGQKLNISA